MNKDIYIDLVKTKLNFALKDDLYKFAVNKKLIEEGKYTKGTIVSAINKNLNGSLALEVINEFQDVIGYTGLEVEDILKINKQQRTKLTKKKILNVTGSYEVRAYGKYLDCPIYSAIQIIDLIEKGTDDLKKLLKQLEPTEKQLAAISKARQKAIENRTCKICGCIVGKKRDLNNEKICCRCLEEIFYKEEFEAALNERRFWLENKNKFIILDNETTGLGINDEIIEIGIVDLNGNVLYESLIKPTKNIPEEATAINGITNEMVKDAPTFEDIWTEIKGVIQNKTIIAYNSEFDIRMIYQTCKLYGIECEKLKHVCLMHNVMRECGTDRFISLKNAVGSSYQSHRSVDDCLLCLTIINGERETE